MGARMCSPALGRFLSPDPAGYADGPNLHAYARSNPIACRDPTGLGAQQTGSSILGPNTSSNPNFQVPGSRFVTLTDNGTAFENPAIGLSLGIGRRSV